MRPSKTDCAAPPWSRGGGGLYNRPFMWNLNAAGGPNWGTGATLGGPYGLMLDVAQVQPKWSTHLGEYALGAILDKFTDTGYKFLMIENERGSDEFSTGDSNPPTGRYTVQLGGSPSDTDYRSYAPWSGSGGVFAFRHVRPNVNSSDYAKLAAAYQTQATGNFLFVDTHVESLTAMARIQETRRSSYP